MPSARRKRSLRRARSLLAALLLLGLAGCAASPRPDHAAYVSRWDFGQLAGYVREGSLHSIEASWLVPAVRGSSGEGLAGTWIGAEQPAGGSFIQIGTNEEEHGAATVPGSTDYYAFWSDKAHHFEPVYLGEVTPLTEVHARMRLVGHLWHIAIKFGESEAHLTVPQEGRAHYDRAEWLQEDRGGPAHRAPYPALTETRFAGLRVDGHPLAYGEALSQWMTALHTNLAPTALSAGSFGLRPATLSPAARRYLGLAGAINAATNSLGRHLEGLARRSPNAMPPSARRLETADVRADARFLHGLEEFVWPGPVERFVSAVEQLQEHILERVPRRTPSGHDWLGRWVRRLFVKDPNPALPLRRALGLPQFLASERECSPAMAASVACAP